MSASLLARPLLIKRTLRLTQPLLPALAGRDLRRKLIAARLAVELILGAVGRDRLLDDLPCDSLVIKRRVAAGVGADLGAIDRDDAPPIRPALEHNPSTAPNTSASACWWRSTNRAIV